MKIIKTASLTLAGLLCLSSCQESLPEHFADIEGVYFHNTDSRRTVTDHASYTFVYENAGVMDMTVPVRIQLLGRSADRDRPVSVELSSDSAVEGVDYVAERNAVLASGANYVDFLLTLHRSPDLKDEEKSVVLKLVENEEFIIPFTTRTLPNGKKVSVSEYTVYFSELFTAAPDAWRTVFAGTFTEAKFELICKVSGIDRALFNQSDGISDAKWMFIRAGVLKYILEQEKLRAAGEEYDEAAFDENGDALDFNA